MLVPKLVTVLWDYDRRRLVPDVAAGVIVAPPPPAPVPREMAGAA